MRQDDYCSQHCPYLIRAQQGEIRTLPFFCELFRVFLAVDGKDVSRCEQCVGKSLNAKKEGYHLISSYPEVGIDKRKTKWGFHRLPLVDKTRFVRLLKQAGILMGVPVKSPLNQKWILSSLSAQMQVAGLQNSTLKKRHHQKMHRLTKKIDEEFGVLLNDLQQNLLSNLLQVLDQSEQAAVEAILSDPAQAKSFLKEFSEMPVTENMLKDFRQLLGKKLQRGFEERKKQRYVSEMVAPTKTRSEQKQHAREEVRAQREFNKEFERTMALLKEHVNELSRS